VRVLEGPDEEVDEARDGSVLPEGGVVGGTERQVADEPDDGLDEGPAGGRVHEPHDGGQAALQAHRVLGHLALGVPAYKDY